MEEKTAPIRVLIVEQDLLIAWDLEQLLEDAGHHVCGVARDADEAIALAERERPDVVLTEIRLAQGTDGIAAAITIRASWGIPSIFLSTYLNAEIRRRASQARPLAMLDKPCDPGEVIRAVERSRRKH